MSNEHEPKNSPVKTPKMKVVEGVVGDIGTFLGECDTAGLLPVDIVRSIRERSNGTVPVGETAIRRWLDVLDIRPRSLEYSYLDTPQYRERNLENLRRANIQSHTPQAQERRMDSVRKFWTGEETRERREAVLSKIHSPEANQNRSASLSRSWAARLRQGEVPAVVRYAWERGRKKTSTDLSGQGSESSKPVPVIDEDRKNLVRRAVETGLIDQLDPTDQFIITVRYLNERSLSLAEVAKRPEVAEITPKQHRQTVQQREGRIIEDLKRKLGI